MGLLFRTTEPDLLVGNGSFQIRWDTRAVVVVVVIIVDVVVVVVAVVVVIHAVF